MYYFSRDINKTPLKPLTYSVAVINLLHVLMLPSPRFKTLSCLLKLYTSKSRLSLAIIFFCEMTGTMRPSAYCKDNCHVRVQSLIKMKFPRTYAFILAGFVHFSKKKGTHRSPSTFHKIFLTGSLTNKSHSRWRFMCRLLVKYHKKTPMTQLVLLQSNIL